MAKPPDTVVNPSVFLCRPAQFVVPDAVVLRTEELLAAAALLNDLDQAGLQLLDGGNVVGEDTHLSGFRGDVDLDDILRLVDRLCDAQISAPSFFTRSLPPPGGASMPDSYGGRNYRVEDVDHQWDRVIPGEGVPGSA